MKHCVRIISKYSEDRYLTLLKSLDFYQSKDLKIKILCMEYPKNIIDDLNNYSDVEILENSLLLPGGARNILLKDFYDSDEDFSIFSDDDSFLFDSEKHNPSGVNILDNLSFMSKSNISLFYPLDGASTPYTKILEDSNVTNTLFFENSGWLRGCFFVLKNIKKCYNKEIYFNDLLNSDNKFIPGEDKLFHLELLLNGLEVYRSNSCVLKEYNRKNSSLPINQDIRKEINLQMNDLICDYLNIKSSDIKLLKSCQPKRKQILL